MASYWAKFKEDFTAGAEHGQAKQEEKQALQEPEMPFVTYNWLLFKCFDACVRDFDNKTIDAQESKCVEECAGNLKDAPEIFQRG